MSMRRVPVHKPVPDVVPCWWSQPLGLEVTSRQSNQANADPGVPRCRENPSLGRSVVSFLKEVVLNWRDLPCWSRHCSHRQRCSNWHAVWSIQAVAPTTGPESQKPWMFAALQGWWMEACEFSKDRCCKGVAPSFRRSGRLPRLLVSHKETTQIRPHHSPRLTLVESLLDGPPGRLHFAIWF